LFKDVYEHKIEPEAAMVELEKIAEEEKE